jgi:uncharacterized membrane protein
MSLRDPILAVHIATGTAGLILGPIIMRAPKRRGRHTNLGGIYHWNMLAVAISAIGLAVLSWHRLWWFVPIAVFSYGNAFVGYRAVKRRRPGWLPWHIRGMGGSYIALTTALLVVNTQGRYLWVWFLPTLIGTPIIEVTIARRLAGRRAPVGSTA